MTKNNSWESWILYMLQGITETAVETSALIDRVVEEKKKLRKDLEDFLPKLPRLDVLNALFLMPYFRISDFVKNMSTISKPTAVRYLSALTRPYRRRDGAIDRILTMERIGRENIYFNKRLFDVLTGMK